MTDDPLSKESALARVKEAGRQAGLWGAPAPMNPYSRSPSMRDEAAAWAAGHCEGAAARKAGKA